MVARITTVAFSGVEALSIDVQIQMDNALPAFAMKSSKYPDKIAP